LKKHAIKLCLEPTKRQDFVDLYKIDFIYETIHGYKASITSDEDLLQVSRQFKRKGEVVIFANLVKKKRKALESPPLESAAKSPTSTVHSATSITTPETRATSPFLIKLALAGSGGKKVDSTYRFPKAKHSGRQGAGFRFQETLLKPS
jgi:hypothetical protein